MEMAQTLAFSKRNLLLAEQHKVGQPIALYEMQAKKIRNLNVIMYINLGAAIFAILFLVIFLIYWLILYLIPALTPLLFASNSMLLDATFSELSIKILHVISMTFFCALTCFYGLAYRHIAKQYYPISLLIATDGMLIIRPKEVVATYWDEVTGITRMSQKEYLLHRKNLKALTIGAIFDNMDDLISHIKQYTHKDVFKLWPF